jgi:hypothetical protein
VESFLFFISRGGQLSLRTEDLSGCVIRQMGIIGLFVKLMKTKGPEILHDILKNGLVGVSNDTATDGL